MSDGDNYVRACGLDDVWEGEMDVFDVGDRKVLIVHSPDQQVCAYDPVCPHQDHPLIEGELMDCVLTCSAHLWEFDVRTGLSINPKGESLKAYPVKVEGDDVLVAFPSG